MLRACVLDVYVHACVCVCVCVCLCACVCLCVRAVRDDKTYISITLPKLISINSDNYLDNPKLYFYALINYI